jgi:hypothetical protein
LISKQASFLHHLTEPSFCVVFLETPENSESNVGIPVNFCIICKINETKKVKKTVAFHCVAVERRAKLLSS